MRQGSVSIVEEDKMKITDPATKEALCIFSALRKLGFPADDIFILFQGKDVLVSLDGKKYTSKGSMIAFRAGDFLGEWQRDLLIEFTKLPPDERSKIIEEFYPKSVVSANHISLLTTLMSLGHTPWLMKGD